VRIETFYLVAPRQEQNRSVQVSEDGGRVECRNERKENKRNEVETLNNSLKEQGETGTGGFDGFYVISLLLLGRKQFLHASF
jgi:hypothetical protein